MKCDKEVDKGYSRANEQVYCADCFNIPNILGSLSGDERITIVIGPGHYGQVLFNDRAPRFNNLPKWLKTIGANFSP